MEDTGERYWAGNYWQTILLTGLSGEKIIGWSYLREKYFPYKLAYLNNGNNNNLLFFNEPGSFAIKYKGRLPFLSENLNQIFAGGDHLDRLFKKLGVKVRQAKKDGWLWLFYDIPGQVFPWITRVPLPESIPNPVLTGIQAQRGTLHLTFHRKARNMMNGFRLHVQIPGFSRRIRMLPPHKNTLRINLPYPRQKNLTIRTHLDYQGIEIPHSVKEYNHTLTNSALQARGPRLMKLSGFGPIIRFSGMDLQVCTKEIRFAASRPSAQKSRLVIRLFSPINFAHPYWYGDYKQAVTIRINGREEAKRMLTLGKNIIQFAIERDQWAKGINIITLQFAYHLPFEFARLWKTAVLLQSEELR